MPNHILNEIIFRNVNSDIQEYILKKVLKDGFIDFNVLVPAPLNIWQGNVGAKEKTAFKNKIWHDWNIENWGTKWNAYGQEDPGVKNVARTEDTLTFVFQTAWSPPRLWICALINATQLPFEHNWLDQGSNQGHTDKYFFSGERDCCFLNWEEGIAGDDLYRHLHILLWGYEPEGDKKAYEI
jgi:hypothetical protein